MKNFNKQILAPLFAIGALLFSSQAFGLATFTAPDDTHTFNYLVPANSGGAGIPPVNLTATGVFHAYNFTNFTLGSTLGTRVRLDITLTNTTDLTLFPGTNAGITMFGMQVTPDTTAYWNSALTLTTGGASTFKVLVDGNGPNQTAPGGYKDIDVCVETDGATCAGGSQNLALSAGSSTSLTMYLFFTTPNLTSFTFGDMPLMFQTTWGSFHPNGCLQGSTECNPKVPEPGSTLLMFGGLGLMLAGYRRYIK